MTFTFTLKLIFIELNRIPLQPLKIVYVSKIGNLPSSVKNYMELMVNQDQTFKSENQYSTMS